MTGVQVGAFGFLVVLCVVVTTFFASGFIEAWVFVNRSAYDGGDNCEGPRLRSLLLATGKANGVDVRATIMRVATTGSDAPNDPLSTRPLVRRFWFALLEPDDTFAGAYCRLGSPQNLPALAKATMGREIGALTDTELAGIARVYHQSWRTQGDAGLAGIYLRQVRSMQEDS